MIKIIPSPSMPTIKHSALDHSLVKWSSTRQWCYIHTLIFLSPREQRERRKEENALFLLLLLLSPVSSMLCFSTHRFLLCWHNSAIHCIISLLRQKREKFKANDCTIDVRQKEERITSTSSSNFHRHHFDSLPHRTHVNEVALINLSVYLGVHSRQKKVNFLP